MAAPGRETDPGAPPPDAAEREFALAVHAVVQRLRRLGERRVGIELIPMSEVDVLLFVSDHPGCSVGDVARGRGLLRTNASAAVRALVGRGLLVRELDPDDARRARLHATPRALHERGRIEQAWQETLGAFLRDLSDADRRLALAATPVLTRLAAMDVTPGLD